MTAPPPPPLPQTVHNPALALHGSSMMSPPPPPPPPPLPGIVPAGGPGGGSFHTVLVTHLPAHLSSTRALRDVAYPCGSTRGISVAVYSHGTSFDKDGNTESESVALIRMATTDGANTITRILPMAVSGVKAYNCSPGAILKTLVGKNNDIKMKMLRNEKRTTPEETNTDKNVKGDNDDNASSVSLDATHDLNLSKEDSAPLEEKLKIIREISLNLREEHLKTPFPTVPNTNSRPKSTVHNTNEEIPEDLTKPGPNAVDSAMIKLDVSKVAAAAGGAYDEEADPLNAPEVLEAVANFKKSLEERDSVLRKKRVDFVEKKLKESLEKARKKFEDWKEAMKNKTNAQQDISSTQESNNSENKMNGINNGSRSLSQNTKDSGKRGVSNLPAWMTSKSNEEDGNASKKRKIESANNAPINIDLDIVLSKIVSSPATVKELRVWVTDKIVEYLGEEEVTLIDFVMDQTLKKAEYAEFLEEMKMVLDEDADNFVKDLYLKLEELGK